MRESQMVSKYYLAGRQRNRGVKCDPVYENRNGVIYRNGVKVGYTPVVEPFVRDKGGVNERDICDRCIHAE